MKTSEDLEKEFGRTVMKMALVGILFWLLISVCIYCIMLFISDPVVMKQIGQGIGEITSEFQEGYSNGASGNTTNK
jgi:hypothetical protein